MEFVVLKGEKKYGDGGFKIFEHVNTKFALSHKYFRETDYVFKNVLIQFQFLMSVS